MSEALVHLNGLSVEFAESSKFFGAGVSRVRAVNDVTLDILRGETLGLVGESGSGKTTLGRASLGLINPTSGRVVFEGVDLSGLSDSAMREMRRRLQIVFQDPNSSLNPRRKIYDIVGDALVIHRLARRSEIRDRVAEMLVQVGLSRDDLDRYPHQFSGGQKQRIGIARALILEPSFLVLDEPVSALDVSIQAQILNLLKELKSKRDLTYLFVAHDLGVVANIADRVAVMYLGRIVEIGRTVVSAPRHPYTKALIDSVPKLTPGRKKNRAAISGDPPSPINLPSGCAFRTRCPIAEEICARIAPPLIEGVACHAVNPAH